MRFFLQLFVFSTVLSACGTSQVIIESQPEGADVIIQTSDMTTKKVGQTPLRMTEQQLGIIGGETYQVVVSKEKFGSQAVVVSPGKTSRDVKISARLVAMTDASQMLTAKDLNEVSRTTAQALGLMSAKNYEQVERVISTALEKYQFVPTLYSLLGNSYYLSRNFDKALAAYKRARDLDPQNMDNDAMIRKIESLRGNN